jgi:hypothetical protein
MLARSISLAINPAGSSFPVFIRKPVLRRVSACCKETLERPKVFWAVNELTFVLILVIGLTLSQSQTR